MIRDPSDGSVKQKSAPPTLGVSTNSGEIDPPVMSDGGGADTSGLRRVDAAEMERLERAREWLKDWHDRKKQETGK